MARWLDGGINGSIDVARWLDANGGCLQPRCLDARLDAGLDAKLDAGSMRGSMQPRCRIDAGSMPRGRGSGSEDRLQPKLGFKVISFHMYVRRFIWFTAVKVKTIRANSQNSGHYRYKSGGVLRNEG